MTSRTECDPLPLRLLSLNIRGLEGKINHLNALITAHRPDIITLQETNVHDSHKLRAIEQKLNTTNTVFNCSIRHIGGTAILQTSKNWNITQGEQILDGRATLVKIKRGTDTFNLVTLHAPSSEPHKRPEFFNRSPTN